MTAPLTTVLAAFAQAGVSLSVVGHDIVWEADWDPTPNQAGVDRREQGGSDPCEANLRVRIDFETVSPLDLTEVGTAVYAAHAGTMMLMLGWCIGIGDVQLWWPREPIPPAILAALEAGGVLVSHGPFDRIVWDAKLVPLGWPALPVERWSDTSARCRAYRVPAKLEKAALRLELDHRKDCAGRALIRRATETAQVKGRRSTSRSRPLATYARGDVEVLRELDRLLPELSPDEHAVWLLDAKINARGLPIDLDTVRRLQPVLADEDKRLVSQMQRLCALNPTQTNKLLDWLKQNTSDPPANVQAETLEEWLQTSPTVGAVREVVETRVESANTSGGKLKKMLAWTSDDGRARDCFVWHGAHTGRWSGRGIQPQNMPRTPKGMDVRAVLAGLLQEKGPVRGGTVPGMEACEPTVSQSVKARIAYCLRAMIKAPDGMHLVMCDFSQVESRVLCWLSGQENMLELYRNNVDPYIATARVLGSEDRQFGKLLVLAAGFGGGPRMLLAKAPSYGVRLTELEAGYAIAAWRAANPAIVAFWNALHETMRDAADGPVGDEYAAPVAYGSSLIVQRGEGDTLRIRLPSGRSLIYHQPRMVPDEEYEWRFNLTYQQAGPGDWLAKQSWRGLVTENVVQAIAYDLMADRMLRMDAAGITLIGTVHDEAIALAPCENASTTLHEMMSIMSAPPDWANGLPLAAEGYHNMRYIKPRKLVTPTPCADTAPAPMPASPIVALAAQHPDWGVDRIAAHFNIPALRIERVLRCRG